MIFNQLMTELADSYEPCSWSSESGKWCVGVRQMMFGRRVFCYQIGDDSYSLDYCTGENLAITVSVLFLVIRALYAVDESISPGQLRKLFPIEHARPISPNDMECLHGLIEMAKTAPPELILPDLTTLEELLFKGVERAKQTFIEQIEAIAHD
jgi:hypothetical protein